MSKMFRSLFMALAFAFGLIAPVPAHAGASIGGQVTLNEGGFISIFVQSTVHLQVWGYSGLLTEKDINDVVFLLNLNEVQYFKLTSLHGEEIGLFNNTQGAWNNRGDNLWHRSNVSFVVSSGENLWAMLAWAPFPDIRGTATAANLTVIFPEGIKVFGFDDCENGCTRVLRIERSGASGVASSWHVRPIHGGTFEIQLEWQEEGGVFPENGHSTITIQEDYHQFFPNIQN